MRRREFLMAGLGSVVAGGRALAQGEWADQDMPPSPAPAGAVMLFDGRDLSKWAGRNGGAARWKVENGHMEVVPGTGDIVTKDAFGDGHLHVEFWLPYMPNATGQARANSGVYIQGRYEVQVLDSYGLDSQDNDCGGIYKVAKPLGNACKKPARWQAYDIFFRAPRVGADGKTTTEKGRITVLHNGYLIHNNVPFDAMVTTAGLPGDFSRPGPLLLQDHGNTVRFRNIWFLPARG